MKYGKFFLQFFFFNFSINIIQVQVPVREEPHHKPVLENEYIRLLDVHINPGDTTQYHIHAAPSVIVFISKSIIGAQLIGKVADAPGEVVPAATRFIDYETSPITHRVYNAGNNVFHVMDIELVKKNTSADSCTALLQSDVETTINEKLVHVYNFQLNAHKSLNISRSSCAYLLVCISGEINTNKKNIKTGEFIFFNPDADIHISNSENNSTCIILQLK